jgi:hypothetical protein
MLQDPPVTDIPGYGEDVTPDAVPGPEYPVLDWEVVGKWSKVTDDESCGVVLLWTMPSLEDAFEVYSNQALDPDAVNSYELNTEKLHALVEELPDGSVKVHMCAEMPDGKWAVLGGGCGQKNAHLFADPVELEYAAELLLI